MHGDLEKVWRLNYQRDVENPNGFKLRDQSDDPAVACAALRRFARWCGRGAEYEPTKKLNRSEQLMVAVLKGLNQGEEALKIISRFG